MPSMTTQEFLRILFTECAGFLEVRLLPKGGAPSQQFRPLAERLSWLEDWGAEGRSDAFFGVYPRTRSAGTADAVAPEVRWVFCDFDGGGESIPQALVPTLVVESGTPGHRHCYWRLREPVAIAEAELVNRGLARSLGGDLKSTDRARVLRLPGTINSKANREAAVAHYDPDATYGLEDFASFALDEGPRGVPEQAGGGVGAVVELMLPYWHEGDRHALALALSGFLAKSGWPWPLARSVIEQLINESRDEEGADRLRACHTTFQRLREGKPVQGFVSLRELPIPAQVLEGLEEEVRRALVPPDMQRLDQVRCAKGVPAFLRRRSIAQYVIARLKEDGRLLRCSTGQLLWFENARRRVLPLEGPGIRAILDLRFGLNAAEIEARYTHAALESEALERGEPADVYRTALWRPDAGELYVDAGEGRVFLLDGERTKTIDNGEQGVFFLRESWQAPIAVDFANPLEPREHLVDDLNFARGEGVSLSPGEQARVFDLWLRSLFFVEEQPTRPILTLVGDPGSGKTSALRRGQVLREGPRSNVHQISKEDDFDAALCANHLVILDNVDHLDRRTDWMESALCRAATGAAIKKREYYTTNHEVTFFPRAFVAITTKGVPFSGGPVGDRLLILRLSRREQFTPEGKLLRRVLQTRAGIWAGLLAQLNRDICALGAQPEAPDVEFRLADWAGLAIRLDPEAEGLFPRLQDEQACAILAHSPLPAVIDGWLKQGGGGEWLTSSQLYHAWEPVAVALEEEIGSSPRSLGKQLGNYWQALTRLFACQRKDGGNRGYLYWFEKHAGDGRR